MAGKFYEDFVIGETYASKARNVTEADVVHMAGISGDFNPLHMDSEYGSSTVFQKKIAHGIIGPVFATGMSYQSGMFEDTTIGFLELSVRYIRPLEIGSSVHLEMTAVEKRITSNPSRGIVKYEVALIDQYGQKVQDGMWTIMMKTKRFPTE